MKNGQVINEDLDYIKLLLDLGALDKGDMLKNGLIKCVFLTEDSTEKYMLETLIKDSDFKLEETDIWSYNGCTKIETALILAEFIKKHAPSVTVIIHRDRDYLSDEDIESYKNKACVNGNLCFITQGSDIESYFLSAKHLNALFPVYSIDHFSKMIDRATQECRDKSIEKFINSRTNIELASARKQGKNQINNGKLSQDCIEKYDSDPVFYRHGKLVFKALKNIIQYEHKTQKNIIQNTGFVKDKDLVTIANSIWP